MAIKVLPPQLANQIAAGEVVERPASIIKELVENSIDAGATRIDISVEQGGCKLIQIRDNGSGICKDELALALTRHATSKIHSLDDLEAIMSLGFRGEALASISSVSRLTLTSKTQAQSEAWQVYAEGRDMMPIVKPASHPVGTTVEVLDIFYNTPARRRFLKTEKTEFSHIEEIVRRIALAYHHVAINLSHNGKLVKQFRAAQTDEQIEKRLASVCGIAFMQKVIKLAWQHDDLSIHGWISPNSSVDLQYFYVNGRVVKDRVLNHALKQALQESPQSAIRSTDDALSYVIYLTLDPHQVDVNVHPAKHEVRFHESRLVHDFVYQAMRMALDASCSSLTDNVLDEVSANIQTRTAAGKSIFSSPEKPVESAPKAPFSYPKGDNGKRYHLRENKLYEQLVTSPVEDAQSEPVSVEQKAVIDSLFPKRTQALAIHLQVPDDQPTNLTANLVINDEQVKTKSAYLPATLGKVLTVINHQFVLLERDNHLLDQRFCLLSIQSALRVLLVNKLLSNGDGSTAENLLIPLSLLLSKVEQKAIDDNKSLLNALGFQFVVDKAKLQLIAVPCSLRKINWQHVFPKLLAFLIKHQLENKIEEHAKEQLAIELANVYFLDVDEGKRWNYSNVIPLISALEQLPSVDLDDAALIQQVDLSVIVNQFKPVD